MRYSKQQKDATRARILRSAALQLRKKGLNGFGVAELMHAIGLTHGGFYAHFESREELVAEAFEMAMDETTSRWRSLASDAAPHHRLGVIVNAYVSPSHRDNPGSGCALPATASEVGRADKRIKKAFAVKLNEMIDAIGEHIEAAPAERHRQAAAVVSTMMGALTMSRATADRLLSDAILEAGRAAILGAGHSTRGLLYKAPVKISRVVSRRQRDAVYLSRT